MKYYRYLDLDYQSVVKKVYSYLEEYFDRDSFFVPLPTEDILSKFPEIQKSLDPLNLHVSECAIIVYNNSWHNFIHIDDPTDSSRINFPVLNCEKSKTNFYKLKDGKTTRTDAEGELSNVLYALPEDCDLVDSFCLNKAAVLRTNVLHNVVCDPEIKYRISLTLKCKENIDYLLE